VTTEPIYAWQDEETPEAESPPGRGVVFAVAVLATMALGIAAVTGAVVLMSLRPDHFTIQQMPVEQTPPTPKTVKAASPTPWAMPPPINALHLTPPQAPPAQIPASAQFAASLAQDRMWFDQTPQTEQSEAMSMCADLASGGSNEDYIDGTLQKSPTITRRQAQQVVAAAIDAYCPERK
jgi:hypothetical protein